MRESCLCGCRPGTKSRPAPLSTTKNVVVLMYYFVGRAGQGRAVVLRGGELDATPPRRVRAVARMHDAPSALVSSLCSANTRLCRRLIDCSAASMEIRLSRESDARILSTVPVLAANDHLWPRHRAKGNDLASIYILARCLAENTAERAREVYSKRKMKLAVCVLLAASALGADAAEESLPRRPVAGRAGWHCTQGCRARPSRRFRRCPGAA